MIGHLRTRLGLYTPNEVADGHGGVKTTWRFKRLLWAAIEPRQITETRENGRLSVTQSYRVTIRYRRDFPERARLMWGPRLLRVITFSDPDTRGERLHLICEEEQQ
jgi:SPP1 family predicted phage head-tail adaptor